MRGENARNHNRRLTSLWTSAPQKDEVFFWGGGSVWGDENWGLDRLHSLLNRIFHDFAAVHPKVLPSFAVYAVCFFITDNSASFKRVWLADTCVYSVSGNGRPGSQSVSKSGSQSESKDVNIQFRFGVTQYARVLRAKWKWNHNMTPLFNKRKGGSLGVEEKGKRKTERKESTDTPMCSCFEREAAKLGVLTKWTST